MLVCENAIELATTEARFRALVADWHLGCSEIAALLGVPAGSLGLDLVPIGQARAGEARMRLLVDIACELLRLMPPMAASAWIREEADGIVDSWGGSARNAARLPVRSDRSRPNDARRFVRHPRMDRWMRPGFRNPGRRRPSSDDAVGRPVPSPPRSAGRSHE